MSRRDRERERDERRAKLRARIERRDLEAEERRAKVRAKLQALAVNEDESEDLREWALAVLDGREPLREERTPRSADGGEGIPSDPHSATPEAFRPRTFTEEVRDALLDKRYGVRHTRNHLLPRGSGDPNPEDFPS